MPLSGKNSATTQIINLIFVSFILVVLNQYFLCFSDLGMCEIITNLDQTVGRGIQI